MFTNMLNMVLPLRGWIEKAVHGLETHSSVKKKFQAQLLVKKEKLTIVNDMKVTITIDFFWQRYNCKQYFYCQLLGKIHLIYWITLIYICVQWLSSWGMETANRVQFLDEAVSISHSANTLGNWINSIILPLAIDR